MKSRRAEKKQIAWSVRRVALWSLFAVIVLELITLISRFGLGLQSTRDTQFLAAWTMGSRIHHGYVGVLGLVGVILCGLLLPGAQKGKWRGITRGISGWLLIISAGLIGSDLVHHFAVLWPLTGSPQFDLRYD